MDCVFEIDVSSIATRALGLRSSRGRGASIIDDCRKASPHRPTYGGRSTVDGRFRGASRGVENPGYAQGEYHRNHRAP